MSNQNHHDADKRVSDSPEHQTWAQRHGAGLLLAGFGLLVILMIVMEKKSTQ